MSHSTEELIEKMKMYEDSNGYAMLNELIKSPLFNDELIEILGTSSRISTAYRTLKNHDIPVIKFKHRFRTQEGRITVKNKSGRILKQGQLIVYWIKGSELKVIERIEERYEDYLTRIEWRDIYIPILGDEYEIITGNSRGNKEIRKIRGKN